MSSSWCFTRFNYSSDDWSRLKELECSYLAIGREMSESGTPHIQGYVEFERPVSFAMVKQILGRGVHLAKAKGTRQDNMDYCLKEGLGFVKSHPFG